MSLARLQRLAVPILLPALARIFITILGSRNTSQPDILASLLISASWSGRNGVGRQVKKYYHIVGGSPSKMSM